MNESTHTGTYMKCVCKVIIYSSLNETRHQAIYSSPLIEGLPDSCSNHHMTQKQICASVTDEPKWWTASYPVACVDHIDQIINHPSLSWVVLSYYLDDSQRFSDLCVNEI